MPKQNDAKKKDALLLIGHRFSSTNLPLLTFIGQGYDIPLFSSRFYDIYNNYSYKSNMECTYWL